MRVERHVDAEAFLAAAAPLAAAWPSLFAWLHAWVDGVRRATRIDRCYMAVAGQRGGFAVQRDDGPVLLGACSTAAAEALADDVFVDYPAADSVAGDDAACAAFCGRWTTLTGRVAKLRMRTRSHLLTDLVPARPTGGRMRVAVERDSDWLVARMQGFVDEAGLRVGRASLERIVAERLEERSWRLWCVDGQPVAFAGTTRAGPTGSRIGPVYTLPAHRNRGHGSAFVAALCQELLQQRPNVFLTTDTANPTSNALYRRLGFRPLDDQALYDLVDPT